MDQAKLAGAVIACSALKEKYRAILSSGITIPLYWVFLQGSFELIKKRMEKRKDHFMPAGLLSSQFDALQIPDNCITIDISNSPDAIVEMIISQIELKAQPETSKNAKRMISFFIKCSRQYPPHKINSKHVKNIVNTGPQLHIRSSIQRLKAVFPCLKLSS